VGQTVGEAEKGAGEGTSNCSPVVVSGGARVRGGPMRRGGGAEEYSVTLRVAGAADVWTGMTVNLTLAFLGWSALPAGETGQAIPRCSR